MPRNAATFPTSAPIAAASVLALAAADASGLTHLGTAGAMVPNLNRKQLFSAGTPININKPLTIDININVYKPVGINKNLVATRIDSAKTVDIGKTINVNTDIDNSTNININKNIDASKNSEGEVVRCIPAHNGRRLKRYSSQATEWRPSGAMTRC